MFRAITLNRANFLYAFMSYVIKNRQFSNWLNARFYTLDIAMWNRFRPNTYSTVATATSIKGRLAHRRQTIFERLWLHNFKQKSAYVSYVMITNVGRVIKIKKIDLNAKIYLGFITLKKGFIVSKCNKIWTLKNAFS